MNVLLTCAGRRNYLVRYFQDALAGKGLVLAADASPYAPALQAADASFILPNVNDAGYLDELIDICREHAVGLLLSLNDLELPLIASARDRFTAVGTIAVISTPQIVDLCFDKWQTAQWIKEQKLHGPTSYVTLVDAQSALANGALSFPITLKPRWGTASIGIQVAQDYHELQSYYGMLRQQLARTWLGPAGAQSTDNSILIQEHLVGTEYGLDIVNDLWGNYQCTLVKRKLAMRAGETDRAVTERTPLLENVGERIAKRLGHIGNLDCDVFMVDGLPYLIEMNPRFGGGYPFSHLAGANIPAALLAWAQGCAIDPSWLRVKPGISAAKYSELMVTSGNNQQT